jgi:hypothetical protein
VEYGQESEVTKMEKIKPTHYFDENDGRIKPVARPPAQVVRPAKTPRKPKWQINFDDNSPH